jgi:phthalate 4,5-cis-dihydrodiol dehydrogenase
MASKLNVAFIGLGPHAWENLLPAVSVSEDLRLKILCSRDAQKARDWADRFNTPQISTDWEEAIHFGQVDAVLVSGPPTLHEEVLQACFKKGLPVFVEKPPAASLEGLQNLIRQQQNSQSPCFVGYNFRFADAYLKLHAQFKDEPLQFQNVSLYANKPQTALWGYASVLKSFLMAVGIHALEAVIHHSGEPIGVESKVTYLAANKFHVSVAMEFEDRTSAVLNMGNYKNAFESQFEFIWGSGSAAGVSNLRDLTLFNPGWSYEGPFAKAAAVAMPSGLKGGFGGNGYGHELSAFASEIRGLKKPASPLGQSLSVYKVINHILTHAKGESDELL